MADVADGRVTVTLPTTEETSIDELIFLSEAECLEVPLSLMRGSSLPCAAL